MKKITITLILLLLAIPAFADVSTHLQDISVTIKSGFSQGSGVIVTREIDGKNVNFVLTAGHVIDNLRSVRTAIDPKTGQERKIIEFKDAEIVKELVEDGRRVGEMVMNARVVKYSDADNGHDVGLLMIRKLDFIKSTATFLKEKQKVVPIGTDLIHVGSLHGQFGSNSMTKGIVSQVGRLIKDKVYDQSTATAFPGSSGGGMFLKDGTYVGMLVRGTGETFNFMTPMRRLHVWAENAGVEWVFDETKKAPSLKEVLHLKVEDLGGNSFSPVNHSDNEHGLKFMIRDLREPLQLK